MDNLEKNLLNLPKPKLGKKADLKIRARIYLFMFTKNFHRLVDLLLIKNTLLGKVAFALVIMIVVFAGASVYAFADDRVTLGDAFYPLKKTIESVEQNLAITKKSKVETLNRISERRLKEALNLAKENNVDDKPAAKEELNDNINQTINEAVDNIDSAIKTSQKIKNVASAKKAKEAIKKKNDSIIQYLDDIEKIADINKNKEVSDKVKEAKNAIDQYNKILDKKDRRDKEKKSGSDNNAVKNTDQQGDAEDNSDNKDRSGQTSDPEVGGNINIDEEGDDNNSGADAGWSRQNNNSQNSD